MTPLIPPSAPNISTGRSFLYTVAKKDLPAMKKKLPIPELMPQKSQKSNIMVEEKHIKNTEVEQINAEMGAGRALEAECKLVDGFRDKGPLSSLSYRLQLKMVESNLDILNLNRRFYSLHNSYLGWKHLAFQMSAKFNPLN